MESHYHIPVLADASLQGLNIKNDGIYVDATFGGGGHSRMILEIMGSGKLIAFDQDRDAKQNVPDDSRVIFVNENFRYLKKFLRVYANGQVDGILADLGVSSWQINQPQRGFSTRFNGPLDMRMDSSRGTTARDIVNAATFEELATIFRLYGELKNAGKIASEILFHRENKKLIETTDDLKQALQKLMPRGKENKFLAQVFQALRIEVNQELEALKEFLTQAVQMLTPGGRLVVISYHSLEDRLVKNFMRSGKFEGEAEKDFFGNNLSPLHQVGKMITPENDELERNPRARSARLRIAERL